MTILGDSQSGIDGDSSSSCTCYDRLHGTAGRILLRNERLRLSNECLYWEESWQLIYENGWYIGNTHYLQKKANEGPKI